MSGLALDTAVSRTGNKSSLPFTILNMEGSSPVLHLFEVPEDKEVFGVTASKNPKFGVVTMNGCILVYDTMVGLELLHIYFKLSFVLRSCI